MNPTNLTPKEYNKMIRDLVNVLKNARRNKDTITVDALLDTIEGVLRSILPPKS